ncbi:helix-turn-helix domain-containing protein [Nocardioides sp.]|uniref:helix-turn-helix domain-containing protein n=1 Tax=Nocardioides sp. TaxID=35761 RepID=UPI0035AF2326
MARTRRRSPSHLVDGWPDEAASDATVEVARILAIRLREAMDGRSARETGRISRVDYSTVSAILNGTTWPDLRTIARLEAGLGVDLWPSGVALSGAAARGPQEGPFGVAG